MVLETIHDIGGPGIVIEEGKKAFCWLIVLWRYFLAHALRVSIRVMEWFKMSSEWLNNVA